MKIEITLSGTIDYVDKISRVMTDIERHAPNGFTLRVKVDGQTQQKTMRNGNRWAIVKEDAGPRSRK